MKKILLFLLLLFPCPAKATTHEDMVHLSAHVGMSFALQTIGYGVFHKYIGLGQTQSCVAALGLVMAVGLAHKTIENAEGTETARSMLQNLSGSALAIGVTFIF